ncbi:Sporulation initiation phosphotransferase F [Paraliobacillus sp. PM-2]|uniref:response regulator n=1 Tax=Paraliobacillus sp. PM-2 TaxID=1462524 RepID=UPI00061C109C|nr:response regulator [Paraliobacillus sp. PM-2]CQR46142.1 Sporulation initiation phosphotransferase F [Paraliobacillus sp. PM-2]
MDDYVLIVDDQIGIRILLEEIVKNEGYAVSSCESGPEALEYIENNKPSLLLIDFWLPVMDGAKVIERIEQQEIFIPTVVLSGLPEEAKEKTSHLQSIKQIMAKPFNIVQVKEVIQSLLENEQVQDN